MNLSPEDIALMKKAIADAEGGHPDADQDLQQIRPLVEAVQFLATQLETINDRLEKLEKVVLDDLIGGITNLYKSNQRESSIADLKSKYGPMFDPHKNALDAFYPGVDIYEHLQDLLDEMKGGEGFSDEAFDGTVKEAVKELQDKIAQLTGGKSEGEPEAEVTVETKEEPQAEPEPEDDISKALKKFTAMAAARKK